MNRSTPKREPGRPRRDKASPVMSSRRTRARALVQWAAKEMKVSVADVKGPSRLRSLSRVRAVAGYLGREVADVPIAAVAREVDRDPSTLWRDIEWLEGEMRRDRKVRADVRRTAAACAAWLERRKPAAR